MYIQSDLENKIYKISKRNFLDDYVHYTSNEVDMTLSGKYLYKYPKFTIDYSHFSKYPTHNIVKDLIETIKLSQNLKKKEVIVGTGANGILQNIVKVLFNKGGNLVTPYLTFNQPEYAVSSMGGVTKRVFMASDGNISIENIVKSVDEKTKMVYLCNPNNPTGILINMEEINYIANSVKAYVVVDESAIEFSEGKGASEMESKDNIIIVKSLSKAYGIANLRVGYMICSEEFKKMYEENITVNEVSGISCLYAKKVLLSNNYKQNVRLIIKERKNIEKKLGKLGLEFYKSQSNILFSKKELNEDIIEKFNKSGISVMFVKDEQDKLHFRIAVQDKKTNKVFIKRCKNLIKE
ncbi:MAG TPA: hypothetical protein DCZ30_03250 [Clostridiales bacterium]|nr:hypothetical protein [Clostridiales bacterium]